MVGGHVIEWEHRKQTRREGEQDLYGTLRKAPDDLALLLTSSESSQAVCPQSNCSNKSRDYSPALLSNDQKLTLLSLFKQHFQEAWVQVEARSHDALGQEEWLSCLNLK